MSFSACIVAAGQGLRAGGGLPKQFRQLAGKTVLAWSLEAFDRHPECSEIIIAHHCDFTDQVRQITGNLSRPVRLVAGGQSRTDSVRACLDAVTSDHVLIHDAARPALTADLLDRLLEALRTSKAAVPSLPICDALAKEASEMLDPVDRSGLFALQTPQAFHSPVIQTAFQSVGGQDFPDEVSLARAAGIEVVKVAGDPDNFKLTWSDDFKRMERVLGNDQGVTVCATGFDVHRLESGDGVHLCGVFIDEPLHLVGHSDADAGLHALTDAILGTIGAGDIGQHFPPTDPKWKGARSDRFVTHALELLKQAGGEIVHADITLICERPKIGPHRAAMTTRVADLLSLPLRRVNIKATTTEKLGFTGRKEGLAAQAIVTARVP